MPTHAELSAKLLCDAAEFFRKLAEQNSEIAAQMNQNADVFDQMAVLLAQQPEGVLDGTSHAELAAKLLRDAAEFFRTLANENEPIREQMEQNAEIYGQISAALEKDPLGVVE